MPEDNIQPTPFEAPTIEELNVLLEGYKFESFIAQGGMGAVYLARQTSLDRQVAIKVLPKELGDNEEFRKSFQNEAKHMAKLNHRNLIGIYDFGHIDGMLYIIMEYVKGKSLHDLAHGQPIVQETAAELVRDICFGLSDAHEAGILHRDIKPANILIGKKTTPKIGDFGLARPAGNTETGVIYGTPGYAAPEVLNAPNEVDARTDIFAVGVMFYELLTGSMPEMPYESVSELAEVDDRFDDIIIKAIQPNPTRRYESAEQMANAISSLLEELKADAAKPANPLLVGAKKQTATPKIVAPVTEGDVIGNLSAPVSSTGLSATALVSSSAPATAIRSNIAPATSQSHAGNGMRNIVIILLLLGAVYVALEFKKRKENDVERINLENQTEAGAKQKIKDELEAERAKTAKNTAEERLKEEQRLKGMKSVNSSGIPGSSENAQAMIGPGSPEYPMKQLEDNQFDLATGKREKNIFPDSVVFRDNETRAVMFINKPMTWDEADQWAGKYGAHLAVCLTKSDIAQYAKSIPEGESAWLGGGNNGNKGWVWVDGSDWGDFLTLSKTNKRAFIKVSSYGNINAENKQNKRLPFFIEWKMSKGANGKINPGGLEERLVRTSMEVGGRSINPHFPAGSINVGSRTYCPVYREMTHKNATQLAEKSGGHLLVVSNQDEFVYLEEFIRRFLLPSKNCWIGGTKSNDLWRWSTGESWVKIPWQRGYPKKGNKLQLLTGDSIKLKDATSDATASMFIIEWSKDKNKVAKNSDGNGDSEEEKKLKKINDWHEAKIQKVIIEAEKKFTANVRKLTFDLEFYLKGLPRNERAALQEDVYSIHAQALNEDRIPEALKGQGPSAKVREITTYGVEKQEKLKADLDDDIEKLRKLYVKHMLKYKEDMAKKGQKSIIKTIDKSIRSAGKNADDYREHFSK